MTCRAAGLLLVFAGVGGLHADDTAALYEKARAVRVVPVTIEVVDAAGRPAGGATVEIVPQRLDVRFGCNLFLWGQCGAPEPEKAYRARFVEAFDFATLPFYWWSYEPEPSETQEQRVRAMAAWCREHGIAVKGHPLFWNYRDPSWLGDDVDENIEFALDRVQACVRAFRPRDRDGERAGAIEIWDVVNEASQYERMLEQAPKVTRAWQAVGQIEMIRRAFARARAAGGTATLLINDYDTTAAYEKVIESLRDEERGFPFDVIGIQSHMHGGVWSPEKLRDVCARLARFGRPLHFTEVTILSGEKGWNRPRPWPSTPEGEDRQARELERFYLELLAQPAVEAITWWDLSDRGAWQGAPAGLLRADMTPKPAYDALRRLKGRLLGPPRAVQADGGGRIKLDLVAGAHELRCRYDSQDATQPLILNRAERGRRIRVQLERATTAPGEPRNRKTKDS